MKNFNLTVTIPIIIFWLALFLLGFPPPMIDDLFTIGPAINLAKNGEFFNPWLADWSEYTVNRYYVQPPIHGHSLAAWLSVFGVSTYSILLFQCFFYILFSIFTALILKKYGFSKITMLCVPCVYLTFMSIVGLRQDAVGMGYLAIGIWFLTKNINWRYFVGFSFIGLALLSSPITISYSLPLAFGILIINYIQSRSKNLTHYIVKTFISWISAVIVIFILFLLLIDFDIANFFHDLAWHASLRVVPPSKVLTLLSFIFFHGYTKIFYGSLYILFLSCLFLIVLKFKKIPNHLKYCVLLIGIGLILNLFFYTSSLRYFLNFFLSLLTLIIVSEISLSRVSKSILVAFTLLVFAIYQSSAIISIILSPNHWHDQNYQEILSYIDKNPQKKYLIDDVAARFVFNYNLPQNSIDWYFSQNPILPYPLSLQEKDPNTVWIISSAKGAVTEGIPDYPKAKIWGQEFKSIPSQPYHIIMVK